MSRPPTQWERLGHDVLEQVSPSPKTDECACCGVVRDQISLEVQKEMGGNLFRVIQIRTLHNSDETYGTLTLCSWCLSSLYMDLSEHHRLKFFQLKERVVKYLDTLPKCCESGCDQTALWMSGKDFTADFPMRCDDHAQRDEGLSYVAGSHRPLDPADLPVANAAELRDLLAFLGRK